jgi:hypothetical protein
MRACVRTYIRTSYLFRGPVRVYWHIEWVGPPIEHYFFIGKPPDGKEIHFGVDFIRIDMIEDINEGNVDVVQYSLAEIKTIQF